MSLKIKTLLVGAGALALTACSDISSFNSEAGAFLDEGGFGNPTMQNLMAQKCAGHAKGYIVPEPIVVLDPKSAPASPRYYQGTVICSGHLNGKYAQVIFREYVRSAVSNPRIGGSGLAAIEGQAGNN